MDDVCGAMVQMDSSGKIIFWNHSAEEMLGYSEDEVLGQNGLETIFIENNEGENNLLKVIDTGEVYYSFDSCVLHKDGEMQPVALVTSPLNDDNQEIYGITILISNVLMI